MPERNQTDLKISLTYEDKSMGEGKGRFIATVKNLSRRVLDNWTVELVAPRPVVINVSNQTFGAYQEKDSYARESRFYTSPGLAKQRALRPDGTYEFDVPYVITEESERFLDDPVIARAYVGNEIRGEESRPLREMTSFFAPVYVNTRKAAKDMREGILKARG